MNTKTLSRMLATALCLLGSSAVFAAGVQLTNSVVRDREEKGIDGRITHKRVSANNVAPGDPVTYVIAYRNDDPKPLERVVITNPVPVDLEFMSVSGGGEVSVDGGKSYGALGSLTVRTPSGGSRAAQAADVTHVRWLIPNAIPPGATGDATFQARVK